MKRLKIWNPNSISPHILIGASSKHLFLEIFLARNWTKDYYVLNMVRSLRSHPYQLYKHQVEIKWFEILNQRFPDHKIHSTLSSMCKFSKWVTAEFKCKMRISQGPIKELSFRLQLYNVELSRNTVRCFHFLFQQKCSSALDKSPASVSYRMKSIWVSHLSLQFSY